MHQSVFFPRRYLALNRRCKRPTLERECLRVRAAKGFGGKTASKGDTDTKAKKPKMKRSREKVTNPMAPTGPSPNSIDARFLEDMDKAKGEGAKSDKDFKNRLAALKRKAEATQVREKESQANGTALEGFSPLDSPVDPPKAAEKEEGSSGLGIPQFAVGALSLLLAGVFLVTSGPGGGGPAPTPVTTTEQSTEAKKLQQSRSEELEKRIKADAKDLEAKRELSTIAASLGNLQRSKALSEEVVKEDPKDSLSWQLLGVTRSQLGDLKGAATAFEQALQNTAEPTTQLLQGLAGVLVNDKRYEEAVQKLQSFESVAGKSEELGTVDLQLLIAKVYSQWDRHFSNALQVYDDVIEKYPNDYRGYLARGALLKQNGRNADAQRMFIKARFFSPPEARAVVEGVINR